MTSTVPAGARRAPLLLLPLLLAACASAPQRERPDLRLDLPGRWSAAPAAEAAGTDARWWTTFGDERLDALVAEALAGNRDLRAAAARVQAALAQARIAGADRLPEASLEYAPSRTRRNFIGFPFPEGGRRVLSTTTTTQGVSINVSWEADLWGRIRAGKAAAIAGVQASQADLAAARLSIAAQTAKAWFALIEAGEQVALARATHESRRSTAERIRRRYRLGLRPALDLRLAAVNEADAAAALARREREFDAAMRQVDLLLARYPDGSVEAWDASLRLPDPPAPIPAGLPSELLARRPDLFAAERRLAAAGLGVREARAALYPRLRLTGSAGRVSEEIGDLLESDFSVWSLAASLLQPLFQGGRLRAGVDLAEAGYREAAEGYVRALLDAFNEVESALVAEEALARQEAALRVAAEQSSAARALAEDRYEVGLADYLSVLEAQRESTLAESQLLSVRRQRLDARVDLHLALGGGFEAPLADGREAARRPGGDGAEPAPRRWLSR
ncbi:MAG: efflux transporter outer membrane subunit [Acidobacteriota bacterium]